MWVNSTATGTKQKCAFGLWSCLALSDPTQAAVVEGVADMARLESVNGKSNLEGSNPDQFPDKSELNKAVQLQASAHTVSFRGFSSSIDFKLPSSPSNEHCAYQLMSDMGVGI